MSGFNFAIVAATRAARQNYLGGRGTPEKSQIFWGRDRRSAENETKNQYPLPLLLFSMFAGQ